MVTRKLHVLTVAGVAALGFAAVAHAQTSPPPPLTPVPFGSDSICLTMMNPGACVANTPLTIPEPGPNTNDSLVTNIPTNAAIGTIVELDDFDTAGHEKGSPVPVPSDYIFSCADPNGAAVICFNSDSENFFPNVPNGVIVATFLETGNWQNVDPWLPVPGFSLWVASDVPEPAAWAMMLVGFGLAGVALRRRMHGSATRLA